MEDETKPPFVEEKTTTETTTSKAPIVHHGESSIKGLSVRALIAMTVVLTVCIMAFMTKKIEEPLYTLATITVGFYFGQNQKPQIKTL